MGRSGGRGRQPSQRALFGTTGVVLAGGFCGANDRASADSCTADIVGGALLGVAIGGLIGGRLHRGEPQS